MEEAGVAWWFHPGLLVIWCLLAFVPLRLLLGGANYLPSRPWYLLCFIIPMFVVLGLLSGVFKVPLEFDTPTAFHVVAALVYMQLDLCVARWWVGPSFGTWNLPWLVATKLSPIPATLDGLSPPGTPPIARSVFELNGALFHEIFWNVCICQNFIDHGFPWILALLAVPLSSGLVHGIVSNVNTGIRCFPNFLWVALAYHASGSVLPPAIIHAMWYVLEAKLCFSLKSVKRNWDVDDREDETETPPWDATSTLGLLLIVGFYTPLTILTSLYPQLRSLEGLHHAASGVHPGRLPVHDPLEKVLCILGLVQIGLGAATWELVRSGMDVLAEKGDLTDDGIDEIKATVDRFVEEHGLCGLSQVCPSSSAESSSARSASASDSDHEDSTELGLNGKARGLSVA